jgi:hypothetical protein
MRLVEIFRRSIGGPELRPEIIFKKLPNRRLKIKRPWKSSPTNSETLWVDNPTSTGCSTCGY